MAEYGLSSAYAAYILLSNGFFVRVTPKESLTALSWSPVQPLPFDYISNGSQLAGWQSSKVEKSRWQTSGGNCPGGKSQGGKPPKLSYSGRILYILSRPNII